MAKEQSNKLFEPALVKEALKQSFVKLNPRIMMRNPVMFTVEIGTAIMLAVCIWILAGEKTQGHFGYNLAIFLILFITFGNVKDALLTILNVPFALIGGILALHLTGINFSISAGIGFIALFGVCIQNGVILISVFRKNLQLKMTLHQAILHGVLSRVRPVIMTALMAAIGLLPAAISTGIGSETQKPLAIVVIGGLVTSTILTLLILPILYSLAHQFLHKRENMKLLKKMGAV